MKQHFVAVLLNPHKCHTEISCESFTRVYFLFLIRVFETPQVTHVERSPTARSAFPKIFWSPPRDRQPTEVFTLLVIKVSFFDIPKGSCIYEKKFSFRILCAEKFPRPLYSRTGTQPPRRRFFRKGFVANVGYTASRHFHPPGRQRVPLRYSKGKLHLQTPSPPPSGVLGKHARHPILPAAGLQGPGACLEGSHGFNITLLPPYITSPFFCRTIFFGLFSPDFLPV